MSRATKEGVLLECSEPLRELLEERLLESTEPELELPGSDFPEEADDLERCKSLSSIGWGIICAFSSYSSTPPLAHGDISGIIW